jgi:hypothetical protein
LFNDAQRSFDQRLQLGPLLQTPSKTRHAVAPSGLYARFRMRALSVAPGIDDLSDQFVRDVLAFVAAWQSADVPTALYFAHVRFGFCATLRWRQLCLIILKRGLDFHGLRYLHNNNNLRHARARVSIMLGVHLLTHGFVRVEAKNVPARSVRLLGLATLGKAGHPDIYTRAYRGAPLCLVITPASELSVCKMAFGGRDFGTSQAPRTYPHRNSKLKLFAANFVMRDPVIVVPRLNRGSCTKEDASAAGTTHRGGPVAGVPCGSRGVKAGPDHIGDGRVCDAAVRAPGVLR